MKTNIPRYSLQAVILVLIVLLNVINFVVITITFILLSNKEVAIDMAGRNRMLSQRIVLFAGLYIDGDTTAKKVCKEAMELHDLSLWVMKYGGVAPGLPGKYVDAAKSTIKDSINNVESLWLDYKKNIKIILDEPLYEEEKIVNSKILKSFDSLTKQMTKMLKKNDNLVKAYVQQTEMRKNKIRLVLLVCGAGGLLLVGASYYVIHYLLFVPLKDVTKFSRAISQGNYNTTLGHASKDELGGLVSAINVWLTKFQTFLQLLQKLGKKELNKTFEELNHQLIFQQDILVKALYSKHRELENMASLNQQRIWFHEGQTQLEEVMRRNNQDIVDFSREVLKCLLNYLNANQGGFFLVRDGYKETYLEMISCYAYNREKFLKKQIAIENSLLGEVYKEGKTKYLKDLPHSYINIKSGLGESPPTNVLMVPIGLNNQVFALIELASFVIFEDVEIDFMEKVSESIAAHLMTIQRNTTTS